jgi:predicted outer membrane repeat protein
MLSTLPVGEVQMQHATRSKIVAAIAALALGCTTSFNEEDDAGSDAVDDTTGADTATDSAPPDTVTDTSGTDTAVDSAPPDAPLDAEDAAGDTAVDATDVTGEDVTAAECGDGTAEGDEECDDGNDIDGDGCDTDCTWSCHDDGECSDDEPCNGLESCDPGDHVCREGDPRVDGFVIAEGPPRIICLDGASEESTCGDGFLDTGGGEFCEPPGEGGCDDDCHWGCVTDTDCPDDGDICNGSEYCNLSDHVCDRRDPAEEGAVCQDDPRRICRSGVCQDSECGDGWHDAEVEECDDGDFDDDDGCTQECVYTCHVDDDCLDDDPCNGYETCGPVIDHGRVCEPGDPAEATDATCDDGDPCTETDRCDGAGGCDGWGNPCDDGVDCTADDCESSTGSCANPVQAGWCYIAGDCVSEDTLNPDNECELCRPATDEYGWTPAPSTEPCSDDHAFCNGPEHCDGGGSCVSGPVPCDASQICREPTDECCDPEEYKACHEGNIHFFDSCGYVQEMGQDCHDDPASGRHGICVESGGGASCTCDTHWTGTYCDVCPGNWDPDANCDACLGNWDPFTDCTMCLPGFFGPDCEQCRVYADPSFSGGDGRSWAHPLQSLQEAVDLAAADGCDEVWAREGWYYTNMYPGNHLDLPGDVAVYGGFYGTEDSINERDIEKFETVLTGDDVSLNVVRCDSDQGCNANTRLDGFTVRDGFSTDGSGGGLYCDGAPMTVERCWFRNNTSRRGGAIYARNCDMTIRNTVIAKNTTYNNGAGVQLYSSDVEFENCLFYGNEADNRGGAIYVDTEAFAQVTNCTIASNGANIAHGAGGQHGGGLMIFSPSGAANVVNTIFWGNQCWFVDSVVTCNVDMMNPDLVQMNHSLIDDPTCTEYPNMCGPDMVHKDPEFENSSANDFHIRPDSPAIDKATDIYAPTRDLDGRTRRDISGMGDPGTLADIGCYEY